MSKKSRKKHERRVAQEVLDTQYFPKNSPEEKRSVEPKNKGKKSSIAKQTSKKKVLDSEKSHSTIDDDGFSPKVFFNLIVSIVCG